MLAPTPTTLINLSQQSGGDNNSNEATQYWHSLVKDGHCGGERVGLGTDTVNGLGVESLADCARLALTDQRCHVDGYFDAQLRDGTYQCKCPTGSCQVDNPPQAGVFKIYQAGEDGLDLRPNGAGEDPEVDSGRGRSRMAIFTLLLVSGALAR